MPRRPLIAPIAAAVVALVLAACTPGGGVATPTPTATVLTEAEAYAAAEETYRAYIDATNDVVVDDPDTFEPVYALSTGRQNSFDRQQYSLWHAEGWNQSGATEVLWIDPVPERSSVDSVRLLSCLDTTNAVVVDAAGVRQRVQDGLDVAVWTAVVERAASGNKWQVEVNALPEGSETCQAR